MLIEDFADDSAWLKAGFNEFGHASVSGLCGLFNGLILHRKIFRWHSVLVLGGSASDVNDFNHVIHADTIALNDGEYVDVLA